MKKIVLFFLFFILGVSQTFAIQQGTYYHSDGHYIVVSGDNAKLYDSNDVVKNDINIPGGMALAKFLQINDYISDSIASAMYLDSYGVVVYFGTSTNRQWGGTAGLFHMSSNTQGAYFGSNTNISCVAISDTGPSGGSSFPCGAFISSGLEEVIYKNEILSTTLPNNLVCEPHIQEVFFPVDDSYQDFDIVLNFDETGLLQYELGYHTGTLIVSNAENLENFSTGTISNQDLFFSFDSLELGEAPFILYDGPNTLTTFHIKGNGNPITIYLENNGEKVLEQDIIYNKEYVFPEYDSFVVTFKKNVFKQNNIFYISYGVLDSVFEESEICTDPDTGENFVNGVPYSGDIGDIEEVVYWGDNLKETGNPLIDGVISSYNQKFGTGIVDYIQFWDIIVPLDINAISIDVPIPSISSEFKLHYETQNIPFPTFYDPANATDFERNQAGVYFIVFIFASLYIFCRILVIGFIFFLMYLLLDSFKLFSKLLTGLDTDNSSNGNVFVSAIYFTFMLSYFSAFTLIFSAVVPIFPFLSVVTNYLTVFFGGISMIVGNYGFFALIVNTFFAAFIVPFGLYLILRIALKFGHFN